MTNNVQVQDSLPMPSRLWAIAAIAFGITLSVLDGAIANMALPTIARDLNTTPTFSIWVVNAYQLAIPFGAHCYYLIHRPDVSYGIFIFFSSGGFREK